MKANEDKTTQPTPEQLMKMLDLQLDAMRSKRTKDSGNRMLVRAMSIFFVIFAAAAGLFLAVTMLDELKPEVRARNQSPAKNAER